MDRLDLNALRVVFVAVVLGALWYQTSAIARLEARVDTAERTAREARAGLDASMVLHEETVRALAAAKAAREALAR